MYKLFLAALIALVTSSAVAQKLPVSCGPYVANIEHLKFKYGERKRADGVAGNGEAVFSVWTNPDTGSWTIAFQLPGAVFCQVASGDGWTEYETKPGQPS